MRCAILKRPLPMKQGDTYAQKLIWEADGAPVNTSGMTAIMQLRRDPNREVAMQLDTVSGITLGLGVVMLNASPTQTAELEPGLYDFDLEITHAGGRVETILSGKYNVIVDVTYV